MTRPYEWILSGLDLTEPDDLPASGFWFKHYGDDWDFGTPGDDPRQIAFTVAVRGRTQDDLVDGSRVLDRVAQSDVKGRLEFLPPVSGPRTLFWVKSSKMVPLFEDLDIIDSGIKQIAYRVTLTLEKPWGYPETVITETFAPGTTSLTLVDNCSANTNWPGTTAVTYLSQTCVQKGPVTAVEGTPLTYDLPGWRYGVMNPGFVASTYQEFTGTVGANNFMCADFAVDLSGFGQYEPPILLQAGGSVVTNGYPLASMPTPSKSGFIRYFWARRAGPLKFGLYAQGMASGDTASFYFEGLNTATVLPSGSLYILSTLGSIASQAQLTISRTGSANGLGELMVYADPTMLTHGWQPDTGTTFATAPDGDYWIYVQPTTAYAIGDVFSLTVAGQTRTTRTEHTHADSHWLPMGPFQLGGRKSRRLGAITGITAGSSPTVALLKNGVGTGYATVACRLIRRHSDGLPEPSLIHAWLDSDADGHAFFVEPSTIDEPQPGMFVGASLNGSDAISAQSVLKAWGWPEILQPTTALLVKSSLDTGPTLTSTHRPPFGTFAAEY